MASDPLRYFRIEARELVDELVAGMLDLERAAGPAGVARLLRAAHTLKGAARVVRQREIADLAHAVEDRLAPHREAAAPVPRSAVDELLGLVDRISDHVRTMDNGATETASVPVAVSVPVSASVSVPVSDASARPEPPPPPRAIDEPILTVRAELSEMDALRDGVAEVHVQLGALRQGHDAIARARRLADLAVDQLAGHAARVALPARDDGPSAAGLATTLDELRAIVTQLDRELPRKAERIGRELEEVRHAAERLRLVPAGVLFGTLERVAWDAARALGKRVSFVSAGGTVRLDAAVVTTVQAALVQLVRNAVAHGIEPEAARRAAGKPVDGNVTVEVRRQGRQVVFACVDDGAGIDAEAVRRAARDRGMADPVDGMAADRLVELLLRGGISTAARVTEIAGRGVGLDLVREVAVRLGGDVRVATRAGAGTTFELAVPLSLAALDALIVEAGGVVTSIPLESVRRIVRVPVAALARTADGEAVLDGDAVLPFLPLERALSGAEPASPPPMWSAVIVEGSGGCAAIGVDRVLGTSAIVLRPLPSAVARIDAVAGASFDGEGNPRLVVDPVGLVAAARRAVPTPLAEPAPRAPVLVIDDSLTTRMLEQSILESAGYDVDVAASAEEGLEKAALRRYALFLVDVEMPGIDGFTFVERTRADPVLRETPAILVTSRSSPEDRRRGHEAGASGYVVKGQFDQVALLDHIRRLLA
jgi:two-component system, chemotaxis family, sensor kinase CheA